MNRDDMIEIMYKATIEMSGRRVGDEEALSHILLRMEEAGMLPPVKDEAYSDYYGGDSVGNGVDKYCTWSNG